MTIVNTDLYKEQLADIFEWASVQISDIKPSDWTEQRVVMPKPFPGPFRYDRTPYTREIIDCLAQDHPARWVAVMKGAQVGFSSGVIYPGIGWIIDNAPGNCFVTVGAPDLIEKAMEKLDIMIDNAGLRSLIKPSVQRNKGQKTGDTNSKKEFAGGYVTVASAGNHKAIRQIDLQYGFFDDFESVKSASKESGSTRKMLEQRFAAYADTHKIFYISTPELKSSSNIEPAYLLGDQRKYMVPCPCCGEFIELRWSVKEGDITGGITWKLDESNKLIRDSVGYTCQKCGDFFTDVHKGEMLNAGYWQPTAEPSKPGYYSYHLSSLYAPLGMYDWEHYVADYLEANPIGEPRKEDLWKSFVNLCLGEAYEESAEAPKANAIQRNVQPYEVGTIPERLSIAQGNGRIVLLTCAADMNGVMKEGADDVRLDYEIVAWAESGATYSVQHGSVGTFIPRENTLAGPKKDREHWTYAMSHARSVWPELDKILAAGYRTDTGREMGISVTGLDCGHHTQYAYAYIDKTNNLVYGVKGDKEDRYIPLGVDKSIFKPAQERDKLFILQVGLIKDKLSDYMQLRWSGGDEGQPANFMNFPESSGGLYQFANFFEHFESEHRVIAKNADGTGTAARWIKKRSNVQNHMWDCRVYNIAIREILLHLIGKELKLKPFTWADYVAALSGGTPGSAAE